MNAQQRLSPDWSLPVTPANALSNETTVDCVAAHTPGPTPAAGTRYAQRAILPTDPDWGFGVTNPVHNSGPETPMSQQKRSHPGESTSVVLSVPQQSSGRLESDTCADYREIVTVEDILQAKVCYDIVNMLSFPDLQNIAEAANILFTVGSNQAAYDLYFMLWQTLLARKHVPFPLLFSAVLDVARSSFSPAQLNAAQLAIHNLLGDSKDNLTTFPEAESTLRAQLADVLQRLNQPSQSLGDCDCALHDISSWSRDTGSIRRDKRALGSLSYQCSTRILDSYTESVADTKCSCYYRLKRAACWKTKISHDEAWRFIYMWCAARLLDEELHKIISTVFERRSYCESEETSVARQIGMLIFCHMWTTYSTARMLTFNEDVSEVVSETCRLTGLSSPDIFAGISLTLVSSTSQWSMHCELLCTEDRSSSSWPYYVAQLLRHVQECALQLVSTNDCGHSFMWALLNACAIVNTTPLKSPYVNSEYLNTFVKEHTTISLSFPLSQVLAASSVSNEKTELSRTDHLHVQSVPFNPTLSLTPRSSQCSLLASMLSLQQKVTGNKDEAQIGHDSIGSGQNRSSWSSESLRQDLGLSMASYRTMSTDDSESLHDSVMDWEPAIHRIQEGIAI